ncbi:hypothetical protein Hanom_Chr04g00379641 [Helianthus anomalus]
MLSITKHLTRSLVIAKHFEQNHKPVRFTLQDNPPPPPPLHPKFIYTRSHKVTNPSSDSLSVS